jgi:hypothetical protein
MGSRQPLKTMESLLKWCLMLSVAWHVMMPGFCVKAPSKSVLCVDADNEL